MAFYKHVQAVGKGLMTGLAIGVIVFGLFFLVASFNRDLGTNVGALIATGAGIFCLLAVLRSKPDAKP